MQFKTDHEDQTKSSGMLCHTNSNMQFRMLNNIRKHEKKKIEATELWFLRRMLKMPWISYTNNEEVLKRSGSQRKLLCITRKRQLEFFGYVMRKEEIEHLVVTGKINGKTDRGREKSDLRKESL